MTLFVDASALVAIVINEDDAVALADKLDRSSVKLCSALSLWEAVAALCRSYRLPVETAEEMVTRYTAAAELVFVTIGRREWELATAAYARFGKGRHPAGLNMGDCFAYACAKANEARLLYKGDDFTKTDLA